MTVHNKLEKSFGPVGSFAGICVCIFGCMATYYSFFGLILVLIGAFVAFTSTSARVDFDKKRVKRSTEIFGIIPVGKWIPIDKEMKIGIRKTNQIWSSFIRSNRKLDIRQEGYQLILYGSDNTSLMVLQRTDTLTSAKQALEKMTTELKLTTREAIS